MPSPSEFTRITRESSSSKVYTAIREAILTGRLKTGERLTEERLSDDFGVSRIVIRETLSRLANDGLVVQNAYKATHVVELEPEDVDEILSIRLPLELLALSQARPRLTSEDKAMLRTLAETMEADRDSPERYAELDLQLHETIWRLSGNERLASVLRQITAPLFAMGSIVRYARSPGELDPRSSHAPIVTALCDLPDGEAERLMREHLVWNWTGVRAKFGDHVAGQRTEGD